jgi:hypothetical protein
VDSLSLSRDEVVKCKTVDTDVECPFVGFRTAGMGSRITVTADQMARASILFDGINDDHHSAQTATRVPGFSSSHSSGSMEVNAGNSLESLSSVVHDIFDHNIVHSDFVVDPFSVVSRSAGRAACSTAFTCADSTPIDKGDDYENDLDIVFDVSSEMKCFSMVFDNSRLSRVLKPARSSLRPSTKRHDADPLEFSSCKRVSFETTSRLDNCGKTLRKYSSIRPSKKEAGDSICKKDFVLVNSFPEVARDPEFKNHFESSQSPFEARMLSMRKEHAFVTPGTKTPADSSHVLQGLANIHIGLDNRHEHLADTPARSPRCSANLKTRDNIAKEKYLQRDFGDGNKENVEPTLPYARSYEDANTSAPYSPSGNSPVYLIDSQNALNVLFDKNTFLPESISRKGPTSSASSDTVGLTSDYRNALKKGGCSDKALSDKWISNHVRWVSYTSCVLIWIILTDRFLTIHSWPIR